MTRAVQAISLFRSIRLPTHQRTGRNTALHTIGLSTVDMSPNTPEPAPVTPDLADRILAIAQRADRRAFAELFEYYGPRLKSYFMRAGVNAAQAEDLAQDTMLNVWRKAALFDPTRARASTWIFVIARNLRIDQLRRLRSEQSSLAEIFEPAENAPSADETISMTEHEHRVRAALTQLSEEQATVVRLSFFADTPHSEIARQLNIPLGTVKSRIRLAMTRLRDLLGESS